MFSRRWPAAAGPNPWFAALAERRREGAQLLDLAEANPTRVGLPGLLDGDSLAGWSLPPRYEPDPRGLAAAREAVAAYASARHGAVDPADIVLTTGTSESLAHLIRLLADPGQVLLAPQPGYPLFEPIAAAEGVKVESYRLAWDGAWHLDRDGLERALARAPRALACVEPHLPAGVRLAEPDWEFLTARAERAGVPLIVDEVFADYRWLDPTGAFPARSGESAGLAFHLNGLSKVCGLPQLKLGWIVIAGPAELRARARAGLEWLSDLFLSVGSSVQHLLPELLERRAHFQRPMRERLRGNLERVDRWVLEHPAVTRLAAEGGWVCVLRLPERRSDDAWALDLLARGVVVHPGHFYDLELPGTVVVSLIVDPAVLDQGLARLGQALDGAP